jgi:hypothetical protein
LVADHVYIDAGTGKKIVAGIFHRMTLTPAKLEPTGENTVRLEVPAGGHQSGSPFCYISLTEIRGKQPFTLRYVSLEDDKALFEMQFMAECQDPLETVEAVFPLPALPVLGPGHYAIELLWGQEPLGCHRITMIEQPPIQEA